MRAFRVLLVDDQHLLREGLKLLLQAEGQFEVCAEAASAAQALELAQGEFDAIVMDLSLPDMDGTRCIRELRSRGCGLPILVVSMHEASSIVSEALQSGAQGYVLKSAQPHQLRHALAQVVRGESYLQQGLQVEEAYAPQRDGLGEIELNPGERELLYRALRHHSPEQIRSELGFSERSFTSRLRSLYRKLAVHDLPGAVEAALQAGLILPNPHGRPGHL